MLDLESISREMTAGRRPGQEATVIARAAMVATVACGRSRAAVAREFGVSTLSGRCPAR